MLSLGHNRNQYAIAQKSVFMHKIPHCIIALESESVLKLLLLPELIYYLICLRLVYRPIVQ
jgi:hypothetical protein